MPKHQTEPFKHWPEHVTRTQDVAAVRLQEVLRLKRLGANFRDIARAIGISRQRASRLYRQALEREDATARTIAMAKQLAHADAVTKRQAARRATKAK